MTLLSTVPGDAAPPVPKPPVPRPASGSIVNLPAAGGRENRAVTRLAAGF